MMGIDQPGGGWAAAWWPAPVPGRWTPIDAGGLPEAALPPQPLSDAVAAGAGSRAVASTPGTPSRRASLSPSAAGWVHGSSSIWSEVGLEIGELRAAAAFAFHCKPPRFGGEAPHRDRHDPGCRRRRRARWSGMRPSAGDPPLRHHRGQRLPPAPQAPGAWLGWPDPRTDERRRRRAHGYRAMRLWRLLAYGRADSQPAEREWLVAQAIAFSG